MKKYLYRYKLEFMSAIILVVISTVATLIQPDLISNIINALNETNELGEITPNMEEVYTNGFQLIMWGMIALIAGLVTTFFAANVAQKVGADMREDTFRQVQSYSFGDIEKFSSSSLVVRMTNDVTQVQNFLMMTLTMVARIPVLFFGAFVMAILAFPQLWWTLIIYIVVVVIILAFALYRMGPLFPKLQKDVDKINTVVKENIDGVRVVKSFVAEDKEKKKFTDRVGQLTDKYIKIGTTFSVVIPGFMFVANIITAIAIYLTAQWAVDDLSLVGELVSYITYLMQIMYALVMGGFLLMTVSRAVVSIKRINEVLDTDSTFKYGEDEIEHINKLEMKNVNFKYPNADEDTLKDISFVIHKGEKIGIVGKTGSGKSTLVQLIPRLFDSTDGQILINDQPIDSYTHNALTNKVSIVLQKAFIFSGTIKDTILQGNQSANQEEIEVSATRAQALDFIKDKDGDFESEVLERGNNFSGGQKQRLSITRGLVKNPELLILDDSTSALDARSERLVKEAINNELCGVMTIIVAQKISSVIDLDRIIVLEDGEIDAIGTHKELVQSSEVYKEIYETQKGKEEEENE